MKKLAVLLLAVCLMVPCFSMMTYAADGKIQFTDPQTKTGETLELMGVIKKTSGTIGKIEISMTYDTVMLKFKSGDGVTETEKGKLTYTADATNEAGSRKEFKILFDVLKTGTTKVEITDATIKDVSGNVKNYTKGFSTITIAQGEQPVVTEPDTTTPDVSTGEAMNVDVDGVTYVISNTIPENEIPKGYVKTTMDYDMGQCSVVQGETSGLYLAYLIGADNVGKFFMYVEEDATFAPYAEVAISDNVTIALLSDVSEIVLPEEYKLTSVTLNEQEFPAWKSAERPDYVILYAINSSGEKTLYQLDYVEGTYQRFIAPEVVVEEDDSIIGQLSALLENHMDTVILVTGLGFLLFILIIVILSVKLYNRNAELDEIYDEYGIDDDDDDDEESETEEDVIFNYDDEDDDFVNKYDDEDESDIEVEFYAKEEIQEDIPEEEPIEESIEELFQDDENDSQYDSLDLFVGEKETQAEEVDEFDELSIDEVLARSMAEEKEEFYDDEEGVDDFSIDFIDLDD